MSKFKPNLASPAVLDALKYPLLASPKLDGIRASVVDGRLLSRTLKEIPNRHIYNMLSSHELEGFDGELIVGPAWAKDVYQQTVSGVMSISGVPLFKYYVFDLWHMPRPFSERWHQLHHQADRPGLPIDVVDQALIADRAELDAYEATAIEKGFEGIMVRDPAGMYKFGRSTAKEGGLLKVKRFEDSEALIIGMEEEMFNGNDAETNELGRTKRSTAQAGLSGKGTMGALVVRDVKTNVEFNIGTGFTAADRDNFWRSRNMHIKCQTPVKYKFFPVGVKDKPRHPVFLGFRPLGA